MLSLPGLNIELLKVPYGHNQRARGRRPAVYCRSTVYTQRRTGGVGVVGWSGLRDRRR